MWTDRVRIKRNLTVLWLALAATMLLAAIVTPSFSATVSGADASGSLDQAPAARIATVRPAAGDSG